MLGALVRAQKSVCKRLSLSKSGYLPRETPRPVTICLRYRYISEQRTARLWMKS